MDNGFVPGKWGIAIDLGYSAVKQFSPVSVIRFPSYRKDFIYELLNTGSVSLT